MAITCMECGCVVEDTRRFNYESICRDCAGLALRWRIARWGTDGEGVFVRCGCCGRLEHLETIEVLAGVIVECERCAKVGIMERRSPPAA